MEEDGKTNISNGSLQVIANKYFLLHNIQTRIGKRRKNWKTWGDQEGSTDRMPLQSLVSTQAQLLQDKEILTWQQVVDVDAVPEVSVLYGLSHKHVNVPVFSVRPDPSPHLQCVGVTYGHPQQLCSVVLVLFQLCSANLIKIKWLPFTDATQLSTRSCWKLNKPFSHLNRSHFRTPR